MAAGLILTGASLGLQGYLNYTTNRQNYKQAQENNREARKAGDREQALNSVNINRAKEAEQIAKVNIDLNRMQARSQAIVAAAASGTAGMSVTDSILDIERNASRAEQNARQQLNDTIFGLEENREAIEARVRSNSILAKRPNEALALLSTGLSLADATYGKYWGDIEP